MFAAGFINPGMTQSHYGAYRPQTDVAQASSNTLDTTLSEAPQFVVKQTCFNTCPRAGVFLWAEERVAGEWLFARRGRL
jgi:hypothetical protein